MTVLRTLKYFYKLLYRSPSKTGMDPFNEKRVFDLLVKMTTRPGSSQYFLLTPKLLPNLTYAETVTVHCIFNGSVKANDKEFTIEEYCNSFNSD